MLTKSEPLRHFINISLYTLIFKLITLSLFRIIIHNKHKPLTRPNYYE